MKTNINLSLIKAIETNDYQRVCHLIKDEEVDVNYRTSNDETPLIMNSLENVISSEARKYKDDITEEFDLKVFLNYLIYFLDRKFFK